MNIVVFSKDRALQLEACLRSLKKHFKDWNRNTNKVVIYTCTSQKHEHAYNILMNEYTEFTFVKQTFFKPNVLGAIDGTKAYTMFLVDDIVFKNNFSLNDSIFSMLKNNDTMVAVSLRLHKGVHYCYAIDKSITNPKFLRDIKDEYCVWQWPGTEGDWGYAYSVDGNIYNTWHIKSLLTHLDFNNPNEFEARLNAPRSGIQPVYMCCYEKSSKLLNTPVNRVQNQFKNRYQPYYEADDLTNMFLDGKRIDITEIENINNGAVHWPIKFKFIHKDDIK